MANLTVAKEIRQSGKLIGMAEMTAPLRHEGGRTGQLQIKVAGNRVILELPVDGSCIVEARSESSYAYALLANGINDVLNDTSVANDHPDVADWIDDNRSGLKIAYQSAYAEFSQPERQSLAS